MPTTNFHAFTVASFIIADMVIEPLLIFIIIHYAADTLMMTPRRRVSAALLATATFCTRPDEHYYNLFLYTAAADVIFGDDGVTVSIEASVTQAHILASPRR